MTIPRDHALVHVAVDPPTIVEERWFYVREALLCGVEYANEHGLWGELKSDDVVLTMVLCAAREQCDRVPAWTWVARRLRDLALACPRVGKSRRASPLEHLYEAHIQETQRLFDQRASSSNGTTAPIIHRLPPHARAKIVKIDPSAATASAQFLEACGVHNRHGAAGVAAIRALVAKTTYT